MAILKAIDEKLVEQVGLSSEQLGMALSGQYTSQKTLW